jgi:hypothetical protein
LETANCDTFLLSFGLPHFGQAGRLRSREERARKLKIVWQSGQ